MLPTNEELLQIANAHQGRARQVLGESGIVPAWQKVGAQVYLVGSLKMGLMMKRRDIDVHIYTDSLNVFQGFRALADIARNPRIQRVEYINLAQTDERCFEWHAWFADSNNELWQLDMIQILRGSVYDGWFESVAQRILDVMTPQQKLVILQLKYETPENEKIAGIEYYQAVIRDGVKNWDEFVVWRQSHPLEGMMNWKP